MYSAVNKIKFSLVSTVFNEISRLDATISDIEAQTLLPTEVIITDAGSTDGTWERLLQWAEHSKMDIKVLQEKGCNVARGRNLAIKEAQYELIASTDFGCRFHPQWLESIITPFAKDKTLQVVGGAFTACYHQSIVGSLPPLGGQGGSDGSSKALSSLRRQGSSELTNHPKNEKIPASAGMMDINEPSLSRDSHRMTLAARSDYIIQNGYPVVLDEYFSVSSRSIAYKKEVWTKCNGYPEWLSLAADDTIFWRKIKALKFKYQMVEQPNVYWLRHSSNKAFAKEAYRYGLGDGEAHINVRNAISHFLETSVRYYLFLGILLSPIIYIFNPYFLSILVPGFWGLRSYRNIWKNWKRLKSQELNIIVLLNAFFQVEMSRIQYIKGFIKGYFKDNEDIHLGRKELKCLNIQ